MLNLYSANRLFIHDITYQNPPQHHCGLRSSGGNITVSNLTVFTTRNSPNTDGLNFVATNSIIENCHISDGDDNIAMGSTGPLNDLLITNCIFGYGHGVSFGSGISGVTNVTVINCSFSNTGNGLRIKCARDNSSAHAEPELSQLDDDEREFADCVLQLLRCHRDARSHNARSSSVRLQHNQCQRHDSQLERHHHQQPDRHFIRHRRNHLGSDGMAHHQCHTHSCHQYRSQDI